MSGSGEPAPDLKAEILAMINDAPPSVIDWDKMRRLRYTKDEPPPEWPRGVRGISTEGLSLFGIDQRTGALYWDGELIEVRTVFTFWQKIGAVAVTVSVVIGAAATVVQAIAAWKG